MLKTDSANELAEKWGHISLALAVLVVFCTFVLGLVYWTLATGLRPLQEAEPGALRRCGDPCRCPGFR